MQLTRIADAPGYDTAAIVARPFLDGGQCNARIIRLSPSQALPPHTHGASDLMLYVVEGSGRLDTPDGPVDFDTGTLAHLRGDEELHVHNPGTTGLTLSPSSPHRFRPPERDAAASGALLATAVQPGVTPGRTTARAPWPAASRPRQSRLAGSTFGR